MKLNERKFVLALCLLAAVRVFVYSAAFPFFNNVDEQSHFDLVMKYSHGLIPRNLERMSTDSLRYVSLYGSFEYMHQPKEFEGGTFPPPLWSTSKALRDKVLALTVNSPGLNHESSQAPLYYSIAALWLLLGRACGLAGGFLLYWIRFLNVFLAAGLSWLGYAAARLVFPERQFVRLGVPVLLAVLPQDSFYSIQNDVLSPICFGLAFIGLVRWMRADVPSARLGIFTGLAVGAVCLVKVSNLPLVAVAAVALAFQAVRLAKSGKLRAASPALALALLGAGLPIVCWFAWNLHYFGDITASVAKTQLLGWTRKPVSGWWHHPIFTPSGFLYFWSELISSFWRGEFVWGLQRLAWPPADAFYWISTTVLVGATAIGLRPGLATATEAQRGALRLGLCSFFSSVGYLALLSIVFDFGKCFYPSQAKPYFTSGRLLTGSLIPFFLVYLYGLEWTAQRLKSEWLLWWALLGMVVVMAGSQFAVGLGAFSSQYNWFHLLASHS